MTRREVYLYWTIQSRAPHTRELRGLFMRVTPQVLPITQASSVISPSFNIPPSYFADHRNGVFAEAAV